MSKVLAEALPRLPHGTTALNFNNHQSKMSCVIGQLVDSGSIKLDYCAKLESLDKTLLTRLTFSEIDNTIEK